jgi:drug/metabolite transporter (DMT)-like permease
VVIVPVLSPVLTTLYLLLTGREPASGTRITGLVLGVGGAVVSPRRFPASRRRMC